MALSSHSNRLSEQALLSLSQYDLIERSRKGISWRTFSGFRKNSPFNDAEWSHILSISPRTLQRYNEEKKTFDATSSERILLMMQFIEKGKAVFGSSEKFRLWLDLPNTALGGKSPRDFLDTTTGLQLMQEELGRIEYGVFA